MYLRPFQSIQMVIPTIVSYPFFPSSKNVQDKKLTKFRQMFEDDESDSDSPKKRKAPDKVNHFSK